MSPEPRCAEVLPNSPLDLSSCLKGIYLRSEPERDTLLHLLGKRRKKWEKMCHVSDALKVFQKDYTFVQEIKLTNKGVIFRLNPRSDQRNVSIKIDAWDSTGKKALSFFNDDHAPHPKAPASDWIWEQSLPDDVYTVKVVLEGHLAFNANIVLGDTLF